MINKILIHALSLLSMATPIFGTSYRIDMGQHHNPRYRIITLPNNEYIYDAAGKAYALNGYFTDVEYNTIIINRLMPNSDIGDIEPARPQLLTPVSFLPITADILQRNASLPTIMASANTIEFTSICLPAFLWWLDFCGGSCKWWYHHNC